MPSAVTAIATCLTVRELSRVLNCSEKTTLAMAKTGQIPCIELGPRSRRFNLEQVLAALQQRGGQNRAQTPAALAAAY